MIIKAKNPGYQLAQPKSNAKEEEDIHTTSPLLADKSKYIQVHSKCKQAIISTRLIKSKTDR